MYIHSRSRVGMWRSLGPYLLRVSMREFLFLLVFSIWSGKGLVLPVQVMGVSLLFYQELAGVIAIMSSLGGEFYSVHFWWLPVIKTWLMYRMCLASQTGCSRPGEGPVSVNSTHRDGPSSRSLPVPYKTEHVRCNTCTISSLKGALGPHTLVEFNRTQSVTLPRLRPPFKEAPKAAPQT